MRGNIKGAILVGAFIATPFAASLAAADEAPTDDQMPLSEVIKAVEDEGYERISEVEMDDDVWEIEAYKNDEERELKVDPKSAEIISDESDSFL